MTEVFFQRKIQRVGAPWLQIGVATIATPLPRGRVYTSRCRGAQIVNTRSGERLGSAKAREPTVTVVKHEVQAGQHIGVFGSAPQIARSEEHTSELQSLMRISYAVFCLKKKQQT